MQLEEKQRGFSFLEEGPLDMRMDPSLPTTAEDIVNTWSEQDLGKIFKEYGEEPRWRKAARAIISSRKRKRIKTTKELSTLISQTLGKTRKHHPATLIFQALRMCVNEELKSIEEGIKKAMKFLAPKGKLGVITFHRLEDRIVKHLFKAATMPIRKLKEEGQIPLFKLLTKKPRVPSPHEIRLNRRARSAKMRFVEKVEKL